MGLFSRNPDEHVIKPAGEKTWQADTRPTMHGTHGEWDLASGKGGLIKQSGDHVQVSGEKPGTRNDH